MKKQKKVKLIKNIPYEIEWLDAFTHNGWYDEYEVDEKIKNPATVLTIGWFVKKENDYIIIAMGKEISKDDFKPYDTLEFIPVGCIKSIRKL